ncbi:MAG: hypothetical protein ACJAYE_002707 [Candidatus Azotimanducaceae bacterium]|jgi:hypothetical protein
MIKRPSIDLRKASQVSELAEFAQQTWLATFTDGITESDIEEALTQRDSRYFEAVFDLHHIWVAVIATDIAGFIECQLTDDAALIN